VNLWERPFFRLLGVFILLGLFAWWTFRAVSFSPGLRGLLDEDLAISDVAQNTADRKRSSLQWENLPAPSQRHAPEVAALLERLRRLPPAPYILANAMARDAATPPNEEPPAWTPAEQAALAEARARFLEAWEPFFQGPGPDWIGHPDSVRLFRSTFFLTRPWAATLVLLGYEPGGRNYSAFLNEPADFPEFLLPLVRQSRNLGVLRLGQPAWDASELVSAADAVRQGIENLLLQPGETAETLEAWRTLIAPAPTLADLRAGLEVDRSFLLTTADFLMKLPTSTQAEAGLRRFLPEGLEGDSFLDAYDRPENARELAERIRDHAEQLDTLLQRTFLSGPAWRQWLAHDPGSGFRPPLSGQLGAFVDFEDVRMKYQVALAALEVRTRLARGDLPGSRQVPDPALPESFLRVEDQSGGTRVSSFYQPPGKTEPLSFLLPAPTPARP